MRTSLLYALFACPSANVVGYWESKIKLNPWSRVLEKLPVTHLVEKFPAFYET
jgi:hypothetical protein